MNVAILTTGGTIDKTYNEGDGTLRNVGSALHEIIDQMRLPELTWKHIPVMCKDSLEMGDQDRTIVLQAVRVALMTDDAVIVVHGTDTLAQTGEVLHAHLDPLSKPVVLTGAMRPFEFRDTDAFQNMTEALLACRLIEPGIYVVMHNLALRFPGVAKDTARMTFCRVP
ncbi:MAG TPA: asparaginase domain-containing protein [Phycisphaerae bacterium]|nr:asparaginase domain-containing protein [Phycisphaerae bacterium]